jgi:hypothetical protein
VRESQHKGVHCRVIIALYIKSERCEEWLIGSSSKMLERRIPI